MAKKIKRTEVAQALNLEELNGKGLQVQTLGRQLHSFALYYSSMILTSGELYLVFQIVDLNSRVECHGLQGRMRQKDQA